MEELEKAISDYLDTPNTNYAILVNGHWGTGKTHFLKNRLRRVITAKGYNIVYVSLYGISSLHELGKEVFFSSKSVLDHNRQLINIGSQLSKVLLNASAALGVSNESTLKISMEHFLNLKENNVLCFDDLERCGMELNEVMGFINSFVEHDQIKTIILCAENEIKDEQYRRFKEKIIGRTITYSPKSETVILQMIESYRSFDDLYRFLDSNQRLIIDVFELSKHKNLRSLSHGLSSFYLFYDLLNKLGHNYVSHWGENILYNTLAITFEIKAGNVSEEEALKLDRTNLYISNSAFSKGKLEKKPFVVEYNDKYFSNRTYTLLSLESIISYCYSGYFDEGLFTQEVTLHESGEPTALQKLTKGYWQLEQDEFDVAVSEVYEDAANGNYIFGDYAFIYTYFEDFSNNHLITIPLEKIREDFLTGLEKSFEQHDDLADSGHFTEYGRQQENRSDFYEVLLQSIEDKVNENKGKMLQDKIQAIINVTSNNNFSEFTRLIYGENHPDRDLEFIPVFSYVPSDSILEIINKINNTNLNNLCRVLKYRYKAVNIGDFFSSDWPTLKGIKLKLSEQIQSVTMSPLRRYNIELLIKTLEEIETKLTIS